MSENSFEKFKYKEEIVRVIRLNDFTIWRILMVGSAINSTVTPEISILFVASFF